MNRLFAKKIADWEYDKPYDIYNCDIDEREPYIDYLVAENHQVYAVLFKNELIAFRSYGEDGQVKGGCYDDDAFTDTGGGLRPDLTGRGLGINVIRDGLRFGRENLGYSNYRVTIASFNIRAQKVCEKLGFSFSDKFFRESDGMSFAIYTQK